MDADERGWAHHEGNRRSRREGAKRVSDRMNRIYGDCAARGAGFVRGTGAGFKRLGCCENRKGLLLWVASVKVMRMLMRMLVGAALEPRYSRRPRVAGGGGNRPLVTACTFES